MIGIQPVHAPAQGVAGRTRCRTLGDRRVLRDKIWFYGTFRYLGVNKTVVDSFYNLNTQVPGRFTPYVPDPSRPGIDDGHIRSIAGRVAAQLSSKDKITYYHDEQDKVRGHWGIASTIPPEASAIQATPTSFVSVSKYTRSQSNKLLFDAGFAVYDQEYQENYQPDVFANSVPLYTINDNATGKIANAWNNPADHFSKLFTEQFAANYVTGAHSLRGGIIISQARWRLAQRYTLDVQPVNFNAGVPVSVALKIPTDRKNSIDRDMGLFVQDKWTIGRATINAGVRYDQFIGSTQAETLPAGTFNQAVTYSECSDGKNNLNAGCTGRVTNWKDVSPRVGLAYDLFGNGKTAIKASVARYVAGTGLAAGGIVDNNNPETTVGLTDTRAWNDLDKNGSPFDAAGVIQLNELTNSTATPTFGKNVPSSTLTDPAVLERLGRARLQLGVHRQRPAPARAARRGQRRLVPPHVRQPDGDGRQSLQLRQQQLRRAVLRERAGRSEPARTAAATRCAACTT